MTVDRPETRRSISSFPGRAKWWQWPTILSLDAPAVAMAWQAVLARVGAVTLARHHVILLGLSVWLAYSADRWIEAWRLSPETVRTQRHYFFLRWRWPSFAVWSAALLGGLGLAAQTLAPGEWAASLGLLAPTLAYLLSHQLLHRDHPWRVPKEACVALILAVGAALYPAVLAAGRRASLIEPAALFALLALANCMLISVWEQDVDTLHRQTSLALRFPGARRCARGLLGGIALLAPGFMARDTGALRSAAACAGASAVLLILLDHGQARTGRELARVLADAALLTPCLMLLHA